MYEAKPHICSLTHSFKSFAAHRIIMARTETDELARETGGCDVCRVEPHHRSCRPVLFFRSDPPTTPFQSRSVMVAPLTYY